MLQDLTPPFSALAPRNRILAALPPGDLARLAPALEPVELIPHQILHRMHAPIPEIHFVEAGLVSLVVRLERGGASEVGIIGREGMVGLPVALGATRAAEEALVQVEGRALRLRADLFRAELARSPNLMRLVLRYEAVFRSHLSQTAACNSRHPIEKRLARWLLMAADRVGRDELVMTQEMLATMLGVRRAGITDAVSGLQRAGVIGFARGRVTILDRPALERTSCECYDAIRREYRLLAEGCEPPARGGMLRADDDAGLGIVSDPERS